jgi:hypothetical protein
VGAITEAVEAWIAPRLRDQVGVEHWIGNASELTILDELSSRDQNWHQMVDTRRSSLAGEDVTTTNWPRLVMNVPVHARVADRFTAGVARLIQRGAERAVNPTTRNFGKCRTTADSRQGRKRGADQIKP